MGLSILSSDPSSSEHSADPTSLRDPLSSVPSAREMTGYPKASSKRSLSRADFCGIAWEDLGEESRTEKTIQGSLDFPCA